MYQQFDFGIVGLGLIGGSACIELHKYSDIRIIGHDHSKTHAEVANQIGLVDQLGSLDELIAQSKTIILAVPTHVALNLLSQILDKIHAHQVVIDLCSVKSALVESVADHPNRARYVPCHPMAGTEKSGPWAAISNLFDGKVNIICDQDHSDQDAIETAKDLSDKLSMRTIYMDSNTHDEHTAHISHLSHLTSFALANTILDKEDNDQTIFDLSSGGFDSTVRLAKSSPDMWEPIFIHNKEYVGDVLDKYIAHITRFKEAIEREDSEQLRELMQYANRIKRILK